MDANERLDVVRNTPDNRSPDPWGVRRAEILLQSLKGVQSARVVVTPDGEITEIHVLTDTSLTAKQVVRNVESALLAQLGIKIDHRRISVAQATPGVVPLEIPEPEPAAVPPPQSPGLGSVSLPDSAPAGAKVGRDVLFQKVEVSSTKPNKVRVTVTLEHDGEEVSAEEDAADTPNMRLLAAARATVAALDGVVPDGTIDLVGAQFVEAFDTTFVFVGVSVLTGRDTYLHTGTCEVRRGAEQAAALGVLDATNRWLNSSM